jgi:hypothetical protein
MGKDVQNDFLAINKIKSKTELEKYVQNHLNAIYKTIA